MSARPRSTAIPLVLMDLASALFGMPFRQAGLIWSFAPVLVPLPSAFVAQTGQLFDGHLNHLRTVAGEG